MNQPVTKETSRLERAAAGGSGGGDMFDKDPRIEGLMLLVADLTDNNDILGSHVSRIRAQGVKGMEVASTHEVITRNSDARRAFAVFVSEYVGEAGSLDGQLFNVLLQEFKGSEASEHCYKYDLLDSTQQAHFIEAIGAAKEEYLLAFSEATADLVKDTAPDSSFDTATLPNLRATHLSFAAIPVTIEEVDQCFDSFIKDPKFAEIVGNQSLEEQFRAFKVARASCGVEETEASTKAIAQFAQALELSA